jgi:hypothetical protein
MRPVGASDIATSLEIVAVAGVESDRFARYEAGVRAVTLVAVRALVRRTMGVDRGVVVVAGDWARLRGPLMTLDWGPIELRDARGERVTTIGGR